MQAREIQETAEILRKKAHALVRGLLDNAHIKAHFTQDIEQWVFDNPFWLLNASEKDWSAIQETCRPHKWRKALRETQGLVLRSSSCSNGTGYFMVAHPLHLTPLPMSSVFFQTSVGRVYFKPNSPMLHVGWIDGKAHTKTVSLREDDVLYEVNECGGFVRFQAAGNISGWHVGEDVASYKRGSLRVLEGREEFLEWYRKAFQLATEYRVHQEKDVHQFWVQTWSGVYMEEAFTACDNESEEDMRAQGYVPVEERYRSVSFDDTSLEFWVQKQEIP